MMVIRRSKSAFALISLAALAIAVSIPSDATFTAEIAEAGGAQSSALVEASNNTSTFPIVPMPYDPQDEAKVRGGIETVETITEAATSQPELGDEVRDSLPRKTRTGALKGLLPEDGSDAIAEYRLYLDGARQSIEPNDKLHDGRSEADALV
jgi:hypothetical protein